MTDALRILERARAPTSYQPGLRADLKDAFRLAQLAFAPKRDLASFVIFGQGRCGSTLLVTLLDSHPAINCRNELLSMRRLRPLDILKSHAQQSPRGASTFGFHLKPWHISRVQGRNEIQFVQELDKQGYQFIHLSRHNIFLHCLSQAKLHMHGIVHSRADTAPAASLELDPALMLQLMQEKAALKEAEAACLQRLSRSYASVVYEEHLANPAQQRQTCDRLFSFLGVAPYAARSPLRKVSPSHWRSGLANADAIAELATRNGFGAFVAEADRV